MFLILVGGSSKNHVKIDGGGSSPKVNNFCKSYLVKWPTKGGGVVLKKMDEMAYIKFSKMGLHGSSINDIVSVRGFHIFSMNPQVQKLYLWHHVLYG